MTIDKKELLDLLKGMPDPVDVEELIRHLCLREKLAEADADLAAGRTLSSDEARALADRWRR